MVQFGYLQQKMSPYRLRTLPFERHDHTWRTTSTTLHRGSEPQSAWEPLSTCTKKVRSKDKLQRSIRDVPVLRCHRSVAFLFSSPLIGVAYAARRLRDPIGC